MDFAYYILSPFTWLLQFFYNLTGSYGFALILFAVVVKVILFPFSLKGKKGMIQMNMLQGKMQQIQKKYANDRERQNLEIQKLYEKEHVNPMSGCLWSFLPVLILLPLYAIIRQPLKYMMALNPEQISAAAEALNWAQVSLDMGWVKSVAEGTANVFTNAGYNQLFLASLIQPENLSVVSAAVGEGAGKLFAMNFDFLGINLSQVPNVKFWVNGISWASIGLFLIPVVSAATGLVFSMVSMKTNQMNTQATAQQNTTNKTMMLMSPIMSLWIGFIMPAGLGVYWIVNNLLSMLQEFVAGKMLKKDYEAAAAAREEQERLEKEEEKRRRREAAEKKAQAIAEAKAGRGKKKVKPAEEKKKGDAAVIAVSGVGIRAYARGRAYDPCRYSPDGPTPYREPGAPIDETAVEKALQKKSDQLQQTALEGIADDMIVEELMERDAARTGDAEEAEVDAASDDPWAELDREISEMQDEQDRE